MKKILLDTNAYSEQFKGSEEITNILSQAETVYISIFVLGELFFGFKRGQKEEENKKILLDFLKAKNIKILSAGTQTAEIFGSIKFNLMKKGTPIPANDIWIAAHTIETGSVLITYDNHFKKIENLRIWDRLF